MLTRYTFPVLVITGLSLGACEPKVQLQAPEKPVQVDLNIKIEHEVRIKIEKDVKNLIKSKPDLF